MKRKKKRTPAKLGVTGKYLSTDRPNCGGPALPGFFFLDKFYLIYSLTEFLPIELTSCCSYGPKLTCVSFLFETVSFLFFYQSLLSPSRQVRPTNRLFQVSPKFPKLLYGLRRWPVVFFCLSLSLSFFLYDFYAQ